MVRKYRKTWLYALRPSLWLHSELRSLTDRLLWMYYCICVLAFDGGRQTSSLMIYRTRSNSNGEFENWQNTLWWAAWRIDLISFCFHTSSCYWVCLPLIIVRDFCDVYANPKCENSETITSSYLFFCFTNVHFSCSLIDNFLINHMLTQH